MPHDAIKNAVKAVAKGLSNILDVLPIDDHKMYLMCFEGSKWGFDQKAFYEYVERTHPGEYSFVWEYNSEPPKSPEMPKSIKLVKTGTFGQLLESKTARFIVCNINPHDYIGYRRQQVIANTWHGYGLKASRGILSEVDRQRFALADVICSNARMFTEVFLDRVCRYGGEILKSGAPRNDILFDVERSAEVSRSVKECLGVDGKTRLVLYAPTFRKDFQSTNVTLDYTMLLETLEGRFGGDWSLLLKQHPMVAGGELDHSARGKVLDVSKWEDTQELLCAADVLVSDYSGVIWDFSQTMRPVFLFVPDIDSYRYDRGLNFELSSMPWPYAMTNEQLEKSIISFSLKNYRNGLREFQSEQGSYERGRASQQLFNEIMRIAGKNMERHGANHEEI